MTLSHVELASPVELSPETINILVVENEDKFFEYCNELVGLTSGGEGRFALFDKSEKLTFSKNVKLISDFFNLNFNDKKGQTFLLNELACLCNGELAVEYAALTEHIYSYLSALQSATAYPVEFDEETGVQQILKAFGIHWRDEYMGLADGLTSLIHFYAEVFRIKCIIFVNLKSFLSEEKILSVYKEAAYAGVSLFLMESALKPKLLNENITLIDKDLCEIVV